MNAFEFPFALFAFLGFVAMVPVWIWFTDTYTQGLPPEPTFLAQFVLPVTVALYLSSWLQTGG